MKIYDVYMSLGNKLDVKYYDINVNINILETDYWSGFVIHIIKYYDIYKSLKSVL